MLVANRARIAELAAASQRPTMYGLADHVKAGGLMARALGLTLPPSIATRADQLIE